MTSFAIKTKIYNLKVGTLAMTNSLLRDWLADESKDDVNIMYSHTKKCHFKVVD